MPTVPSPKIADWDVLQVGSRNLYFYPLPCRWITKRGMVLGNSNSTLFFKSVLTSLTNSGLTSSANSSSSKNLFCTDSANFAMRFASLSPSLAHAYNFPISNWEPLQDEHCLRTLHCCSALRAPRTWRVMAAQEVLVNCFAHWEVILPTEVCPSTAAADSVQM